MFNDPRETKTVQRQVVVRPGLGSAYDEGSQGVWNLECGIGQDLQETQYPLPMAGLLAQERDRQSGQAASPATEFRSGKAGRDDSSDVST